jgi:hypothetical protein
VVDASIRQTSMRSGSQAAATAPIAERPSSIQTESMLATHTGLASSNGFALRSPPPVSSARSRSSEMTMRGAVVRPARCASMRSAK